MKSCLIVLLLIFGNVVGVLAEVKLVSKVYRVPKALVESLPKTHFEPTTFDLDGIQVSAYNVRRWFEDQGLMFSKSERALYVPELEAFVLLSRQANVDLADSLLDGCLGLPPWSLKNQLTLVSFRAKDQASEKSTPSYAELKNSAGESWTIISSLVVTSKNGSRVFGSTIRKGSIPAVSADQVRVADLPSGTEGACGAVLTEIISQTGVELQSAVSYRFRGKDKQGGLFEFSYDGELQGEIDTPQVLQLVQGDLSYALVLSVEWVVPDGKNVLSADSNPKKTN